MSPAVRALGSACFAFVLVAQLVSCGADKVVPSAQSQAPATFAPARTSAPQHSGAEECADCHRDVVESWSQTGMARSLQAPEVGELDGLGIVADGASGYRYQFARTSDGNSHVLGETHAAAPGFALGSELVLAIGSGERDRSYAALHGRGLWFAPIEVLTTPRGRHAVLAPGAMMNSGLRLTVPITPECLGCHTDAPPPKRYPLNTLPDANTWEPRGISCAACHGEDGAHAQWQEASLSGDDPAGTDPILRHTQLNRWQQLSVCAACHLQGDARLVLNGRELGPPEPGGDLLEQRALFVAADATSDVGFVSQVERLALSECFLASEMTCTTCHDAHSTLHQAPERARVRAACTNCHAADAGSSSIRSSRQPATASMCSRNAYAGIETHSVQMNREAGLDCVDCHMPITGVFDVAAVTIHDHFIRRKTTDARLPAEAHELRVGESAAGDWKRFQWPGQVAPKHLNDAGLWMMAFASAKHFQRALDFMDRAPGAVAARLPMYHHVRGSLLEGAGRIDEALDAYERALSLDPGLAPSAINMGLALGKSGRAHEGLALLTQVIERHPFADSALRNRAVLRHESGDFAGFAQDLERAFDANPRAELAANLSAFYQSRGDAGAAKKWHELAVRLDPLFTNSNR